MKIYKLAMSMHDYWMDPYGKLYRFTGDHNDWARKNKKCSSQELLTQGWIRISLQDVMYYETKDGIIPGVNIIKILKDVALIEGCDALIWTVGNKEKTIWSRENVL